MKEKLQQQMAQDLLFSEGIVESLPLSSIVQPISATNDIPLRVLDLACGECHEAETLVSTLKKRQPERTIEFVGSDLREREISNATARLIARPEFRFLSADLSNQSAQKELGEKFDLVLLRHQNYWNDPLAWEHIFANGLSQLKEGGQLLITSYFDQEHLLARQALTSRLGAKEVLTRRNFSSRELVTPGKSVDRHCALFSV